jgi:uncharacterized OB-fold protein
MTMDQPYPAADSDSAPFWAGCAAGQLLIANCASCQQRSLYLRGHCPHCGADEPARQEASGQGTIYACTTVHRAPAAFRDEAPYVVALVELAEGPRIMARIDQGNGGEPRIGAPVTVDFRPGPADFSYPWFVLTEAG